MIGWGLGWMLYRDGVVGHTGVSKGRKAFLRVVPSAGVAVVVLTNSTVAEPSAYEIISSALADLAGVETTSLPVPPRSPARIDADRMCGTYRSTLYDVVLSEDSLTYHPRTPVSLPQRRVEVVRLHQDTIITVQPQSAVHEVFSLVGSDDQGRARFLHNGAAFYRID